MNFSKETYYALLESPMWKKFRKEFLRSRGQKCAKCGRKAGKDVILQVHHTHYREGAKPWEYRETELVPLCTDCHARYHQQLLADGLKISVVDNDGNPVHLNDEQLCLKCLGKGYLEDFKHIMGGICFRCFGTGIRNTHRYSEKEAEKYSYRIYNDWLTHRENCHGEDDTGFPKFDGPEDVKRWLLLMNDYQDERMPPKKVWISGQNL